MSGLIASPIVVFVFLFYLFCISSLSWEVYFPAFCQRDKSLSFCSPKFYLMLIHSLVEPNCLGPILNFLCIIICGSLFEFQLTYCDFDLPVAFYYPDVTA